MKHLSREDQTENDEAFDAAMEKEWKMKTLENELTQIAKKIITRIYPEVFSPDSKEYEALDSVVWSYMNKLVREVNKVADKTAT